MGCVRPNLFTWSPISVTNCESTDAFTAGLVNQYLRGVPLSEANDFANRMGAWVASNSGAMPPVPDQGLVAALAEIG